MPTHNTQVAIIGGGPSGLLLGQLLQRHNIGTIIIERKTKDYVLSRIRAGVLERGLVNLLEEAGCAGRLRAEGFTHDGTQIAVGDSMFQIDFKALTGHAVTVYGQTELTADLYAAREAINAPIHYNVEDVQIIDANSTRPGLTYTIDGEPYRINATFIAGCDGFHGVSRNSIPTAARRDYEKIYPFGWLGILSETPPVDDELIYANGPNGFALCSMRNANLSRYYIQCQLSDAPEDWTDEAFWHELKQRIPKHKADQLITGPSIEKSIAPLRSFVCEPMRYGNLFLCGDAAHIVPPTGAKGLNTAASDVHYLFDALMQYFKSNNSVGIDNYSARALQRVWKTQRFSWWFSSLMHHFPEQTGFDRQIQRAELNYLQASETAQKSFAENYVGLPYD